jgi:hypothetical protein
MATMISITVEHAVEVLNRALKADPVAVQKLFAVRVACAGGKGDLLDDPTVQIRQEEDDTYSVGVLGIINGLFGVDAEQWGYISAVYDEVTDNVIEFKVRGA